MIWIIAYSFICILLFLAWHLKDREIKFRLRIAGNFYMVFLNIVFIFDAETIWFKFFYGFFIILFLVLPYKDYKSTKYFDGEFARLDRQIKESNERIAALFYDRRN